MEIWRHPRRESRSCKNKRVIKDNQTFQLLSDTMHIPSHPNLEPPATQLKHHPPEPATTQYIDAPFTKTEKIINYLWALAVISGAMFALNKIDFMNEVLTSPKINHGVMQIGLSMTILLMFIKIYMETIKVSIMKQECTYANNKDLTHAAIALIMITSVTLHWAMWGLWGWYTPIVMAIMSYGVLMQLIVLIPNSIVQNMLCIVGGTYFLQVYVGV